MADRIADNADLAIDEVKRRARRRLVGAVVLALAAAILLPMLLEKEPRPLGDDVSVQIPPVDEGKFVNRLTGKAGDTKPLPKVEGKLEPKAGAAKPDGRAESKPESAAEPKPEAKAEPASEAAPGAKGAAAVQGAAPSPAGKSLAEAEQRVLSPTQAQKAPAKVEPRNAPATKPAPKAPAEAKAAPKVAATEAKAETRAAAAPAKAESASAPAPDAKPEPKPAASDSPAAGSAPAAAPATATAAPPKADGFVVQLAAFADDKGANALANKLGRGGYTAYVEPVQTSRGTLWRVRVGGYASRADADVARAKLKGEGYSGIVAPAK